MRVRYSVSEDDLYDVIEEMEEHDYCPNGPQVSGCPLDETTGMVMSCSECWLTWFEDNGFVRR